MRNPIERGVQLLRGLMVPRRGRPGDAPTDGAWLYCDDRTGRLRYRSLQGDEGLLDSGQRGAQGGVAPMAVLETADPTATDDTTAGRLVGQVWVNTSTDAAFICVDNTASAAVWRSLLSGSRRLKIDLAAGSLAWSEELWTSAGWVRATARTALSVDVDGGVTFSGDQATLPSGWTSTLAPHTQQDRRYVALSSTSAAFQALLATAAVLVLDLNTTGIATSTSFARVGCALAATGGGSFDASSENIAAMRKGYDGANYLVGNAYSTANFSGTPTAATATVNARKVLLQGVARGMFYYNTNSNAGSPATSTPDRLYWLAGSSGTMASSHVFTGPTITLTPLPMP